MLALTRKRQQRIRIQCECGCEPTWLTILEVDHGKVRLGFEAPPGVEIMRQEIIPPVTEVKP